MPLIGYLSTRSLGNSAYIVAALRKGLHEVGFTEGRNVAIEFRFAEGHHDRLRALTADLVRRQVNVIVATGGTASAVAAKPIVAAAIPMVFAMGGDPVKLGIGASYRPRPQGRQAGAQVVRVSSRCGPAPPAKPPRLFPRLGEPSKL